MIYVVCMVYVYELTPFLARVVNHTLVYSLYRYDALYVPQTEIIIGVTII